MTGAQILIESLKAEGVDLIFGYPGGQAITIFDALYQQNDVKVILPRHEQAAGHAADGYARATGKVGVVLATSGPGATNLVTAIATAYMDSVPMIAITGQVKTSLIGTDAFQESDITGITYPVTKHNYLVKDVKDLAKTIKEAFHIARTGRPGPVLIDIPADIAVGQCEFQYPETVSLRSYNPNYEGHPGQIKKALKMIEKALKPVAIVGGGIIASGAHKELLDFINITKMPIASTLMGLGSIPSDHPSFLGMLGMHGTVYANYSIMDADLILNIGGRFVERVTGKHETFAPNAKIIHIDIDPSSIGKNVPAHLPIVGDAKNVLTQMNKDAKKLNIEPWLEKIDEWKKEYPLNYIKSDKVIKPQFVLETINKLTEGKNVIFTTEVGQHQMWAAQFLKLKKPRQFLTSGGLGTMGFGFPASIGAQFAMKDSLVIAIAGDGSFQMNLQELATVKMQKLPIKIIILNNTYLGMVRQWQELFYEKRYSSTCLSRDRDCPPQCEGKDCVKYIPDFVKLADAYGIPGFKIKDPKQVETVLKHAIFEEKGPALIEVMIAKEENVMPMVPGGHPINNIIQKYE